MQKLFWAILPSVKPDWLKWSSDKRGTRSHVRITVEEL